MNFIKQMNPMFVPLSLRNKGEVLILRERILQGIMLFFSTFGLLVIGMAVVGAIQKGIIPLAVFYAALYLAVLAMAIFRDLPYAVRGRIVMFLFFTLSISEAFDSGMLGEMRVFLLMMCSVTAIFYDFKNVIATIVLSVAVIVGFGMYVEMNEVTGALSHFNDGTGWLLSAVMTASLSIILSGAISFTLSGLASSLQKQSELTQSLETERDTLEDRIQERTRSVNRRMVQLRTAAEISRAVGALSNPDELLQRVVDLVKERFDLYYVGVFLLDENRQNAVLHSGTGEAGKNMIAARHSLSTTGSSMIGWCVSNRSPRVALDVGSEAVRFSNPHLPNTRSELALPLIAHDTVQGAMTIQSDRSNAFDDNDIAILSGIADSVAIALENDRLFHETRERLEEVRMLNREYLQNAWAETIDIHGNLSYQYEAPGLSGYAPEANTVQVPMMLRDEVFGYIQLELEGKELSAEDQAFIESVTTQTAVALENARLLLETEQRVAQEQKLNELAARFSRALSIDEILRAAVQELGQLPAVAEASVQIAPVSASIQAQPRSAGPSGANGKEHLS